MRFGAILLAAATVALTAPASALAGPSARAESHLRSIARQEHRASTAAQSAALVAALPPVQLVTPTGVALGGVLQQWANAAQVPTGDYRLVIAPDQCDGAQSPTHGASLSTAPGCSSWGGHDGLNPPAAGPATTEIDTVDYVPGFARATFYFELGHQFDWHFLTDADRAHLARAWGLARWHWRDTLAGLNSGAEDGLEAMFAEIYSNCAQDGASDKGSETALWEAGGPPPASPRINDCAFIRRVALRSS